MIRKRLAFFLFAYGVFLSFDLFSQTSYSAIDFHCGLAVNSQMQRIWDNPKEMKLNKILTSYYAGADYNFHISRHHFVGIGIQFIEKGMELEYGLNDPPGVANPINIFVIYYNYLLEYIEVPLTYGYTWGDQSISLGIIASYLSGASYTEKEINMNPQNLPNYFRNSSFSSTINYKDNFHPFDVCMKIGFSRKIYSVFYLDLALQRGLTNPYYNHHSTDMGYNQSILMGIRYKLQ